MKKSRERILVHVYSLLSGTTIVGLVAPIVSLSLGAIKSDGQIVNIVFSSVLALVNSGYLVIKILESRWREDND